MNKKILWEGVGVCSYLLVHFWYTRVAAVKSAENAMFTNRVGDFFLTIGFFALFFTFGTLDYATIFSLAPYININVITFISILLLLGAAAKSAQLGQKALKSSSINKLFVTLVFAEKTLKSYINNGDINQQDNYIKLNKFILNFWDKDFLDWFIGFSEGDGSFYVTNNKIIFSIHLHIADLSLLYEIQGELNMGVVYSHSKSNSAYFMVKAKKDILNIIEIFNGKLYLKKKQKQFKNWVFAYNKKYNCNILIKDFNFQPTLSDSWIAGFIDAEGSFLVTVSRNKIIQRIVISQNEAEEEFSYLSGLLGGYPEKGKLNKNDRIIVNYLKLSIVINYLNKNKLRTIKAKSFDKWVEIYNYRKSIKKLNEEDIKFVKIKASLINTLRKLPKSDF